MLGLKTGGFHVGTTKPIHLIPHFFRGKIEGLTPLSQTVTFTTVFSLDLSTGPHQLVQQCRPVVERCRIVGVLFALGGTQDFQKPGVQEICVLELALLEKAGKWLW